MRACFFCVVTKEGHGPHFTAKMVVLVPNRPQSCFTIETLKSAVITKICRAQRGEDLGFHTAKRRFAMNLGRQTPQFIVGIHLARWPCNVPRHATACVHSAYRIVYATRQLPQRSTTGMRNAKTRLQATLGF